MKKSIEKQKGVSLIITFFIMMIILDVVLAVSVILYSEVKVIKNIGNSMTSLYAADSGVEKLLYYDKQVVPTGATRGLCSMLVPSINNPYCASGTGAIYCNNPSFTPGNSNPQHGCDSDVCNNCTISFDTTLSNEANYRVTASVDTVDSPPYYLNIQSIATFGGTERKIEVITENPPQ